MIQGHENFTYRGYVNDNSSRPSLVFKEGVYLQSPGAFGSASVGWYPRDVIYQGGNITLDIVEEFYMSANHPLSDREWFERVIMKGVFNATLLKPPRGGMYYCIRNSPKPGINGKFIIFQGAFIPIFYPSFQNKYGTGYAQSVLRDGEFSAQLSAEERNVKLPANVRLFEGFGSLSCIDECKRYHPNDKESDSVYESGTNVDSESDSDEGCHTDYTGQMHLDNIDELSQHSWFVCGFAAAIHAAYYNGNKKILKGTSYETFLDVIGLFARKLKADPALCQEVLKLTSASQGVPPQTLGAIMSELKEDKDMEGQFGFFLPPDAVLSLCNMLGLSGPELDTIQPIRAGLNAGDFIIGNCIYGLGSSIDGKADVCNYLHHWIYVDGQGHIITWGKKQLIDDALGRLAAGGLSTLMYRIRFGKNT